MHYCATLSVAVLRCLRYYYILPAMGTLCRPYWPRLAESNYSFVCCDAAMYFALAPCQKLSAHLHYIQHVLSLPKSLAPNFFSRPSLFARILLTPTCLLMSRLRHHSSFLKRADE